jgi:hypothetical protein
LLLAGVKVEITQKAVSPLSGMEQVGGNMNRFFIVFFMVVGAGDFLYGIFFKDRVSVLVGAIMSILTIYVARK